ncbi:MAG: PQQ-binding-like beta-propeller repeat protein [Anaerolineae bacterium]
MAVVRSRFWLLGAAALLLMLALSACSGGPTEPSWGQIGLLDNNVLFTFSHTLVQLNPVDGSAVGAHLSDGTPRTTTDSEGRSTNQAVSWAITAPNAIRFYQTPLILDESTLLAPSYDRKFFYIDRMSAIFNDTTGIDIPGHIVGNILRDGDVLYVPLSEADLLALNVSDLSQIWRFTTERGVWSQPLLNEGILYVTAMDHHLYAVDAATGNEIWRLDLGGAVAATPLLYNNYLYVGTFGRKIYKISLDGQVAAEYTTADWVWGTPVVADDTLYAADLVGNVYALSLTGDGFTEIWRRQVASRQIRPSPVVIGDRLAVGSSDHFVYWLNRTDGSTIISRDVQGEVEAEMLLVQPSEQLQIGEPLLLVSTMNTANLLYAFPADGNSEPRWKYPR